MGQTNAEIFEQPIFDLPIIRNDGSIKDYTDALFSSFLDEISKFNKNLKHELTPKIPFIQSQIKKITQSLEYYLSGFPSEAYSKLSEALNALHDEDYLPIQKAEISLSESPFYRTRVSTNKVLKREDLFHIPFELREKVATQRYSIPGLPCLYLADSIFVCWEEMNRPEIEAFHVSRIDLSRSRLKFLYFNVATKELRKQCFPKSNKDGKLLNLLIPFLCYWPMLAACSMIVKKPNEVFKPEYIVPQLLLQWVVTEQKVDGVVYKSNRIKVSNHNIGTFKNIVIPVRKIAASGFCLDLKKRIKLTIPVSYKLLEIAGGKASKKPVTVSDLRRAMYIELIEGEKAIYSETIFGKLEDKLNSLSSKYI